MIRPRAAASAALLTLAASFAGVFVIAGPASAHVSVNPKEAEQGGYARLAFRVPNESESTNTTKLEIFLPDDAPVASVSTMPVPGWTARVERKAPAKPVTAHGQQVTEVVSKITWTAAPASAVKPGQFQEFPVSMGPLPEVDKMVFKALQTYSDGNIVRWIEEPVDGGQEPESPAPVLKLLPAAAEGSADGGARNVPAGSAEGSGEGAADGDAAGPADQDGSGPAVPLAIAGLVVGLLGAVLGGLALVRGRGAGRAVADS